MSEKKAEIKPQILFIVDTSGWAHDIKTENLRKHLEHKYDIIKVYQRDITPEHLNQADLILVYYWLQFKTLKKLGKVLLRNKRKILAGICSHHELSGSKRAKGLKYLRRYSQAIFANSMLLFNEFKSHFDIPFYYTPNGVDTEFFHPPPDKQRGAIFRVGWAGSRANQGADHRGLDNYIIPALEKLTGVEFSIAAREDKWRDAEEMRDFYHSLDVYICASRSEGTPNPCLEAAACGVPLLTTRVGNMPELIEDGVNGLYIERNINLIAEKIAQLRDDRELYDKMCDNIIKSIQEWDWKIMSENYDRMISEMLLD